MTLSAAERARYQRHLSLREIGAAGQEKLKAARVLIVGAGGLGSPAALYLAAAGCGALGLVDFDRVDVSNLQRQVLFDTAAIGELKAEAGRERLAALNPEIRVVAHALELKAASVLSLLAEYDLVVDGSDRLSTRYIVNDACVILGRPLVSAAIHRFEGQLTTYVPGRGPCYRCLFPQAADGMVANCAEAGVLGVLPGVLGTLQATEAIKLITGVGTPLVGRLLTYDALELRFHEFRVERRRDCAVCGEAPTITAPPVRGISARRCGSSPSGMLTASGRWLVSNSHGSRTSISGGAPEPASSSALSARALRRRTPSAAAGAGGSRGAVIVGASPHTAQSRRRWRRNSWKRSSSAS